MEVEDPGGTPGTVDDASGSLQGGEDMPALRFLQRDKVCGR